MPAPKCNLNHNQTPRYDPKWSLHRHGCVLLAGLVKRECHRQPLRYAKNSQFYCALGPTVAAMCELKRNSAQTAKRKAGKRSLFENGEMAVTLPPQPRFQAVGLANIQA